jgi:glycosyltransferase involved in cell wall biosynthesis
MRILQIGPIPPEIGGRTRGGVATHVWGLATHLAGQNHQVAVLADNTVTEHRGSVMKDGIEIYSRLRPLRAFQSLTPFTPEFWRNIRRIKRYFGRLQPLAGLITLSLNYCHVMTSFRPEIIHVHHLENRFPYAYFLTNGRVPLVTTVHSTHSMEFVESPMRNLRHQLIERNLGLANDVIFVGHYVKKRYEELFPRGLDRQRTWVIQNPINVSEYRPIPQEEARRHIGKGSEQPLILFVGGLIPRKGAKTLIESAVRLRSEGITFHLMIVGDGPQKGELKRMIEENHLLSHVSLEGPKSQAELPYYYSAADLFVLPSSSEGFALVFVEAIACGCPIIGTQGVVDELIVSEDYGFVVPPNDAIALFQVIEKALRCPWNREKIRKHALQFDWAVKVHEFEEVYQIIIDHPVRARTPSSKPEENF